MRPNTVSSTTSLINISAIGLASLILGGCQRLSPTQTDVAEVAAIAPGNWSSSARDLQSVALSQTEKRSVPHQWVERLQDPMLDRLIEEAIRNNKDLKLAAARLENSRQLMRIARAGLFPSIGLEASGTLSNVDTVAYKGTTTDSYLLTLGASWEADIWGKVRNTARSGEADFMASDFDLTQARHALVGAVCSAWYDCIAAHEQLELARATVESYVSTADLIQNRFERGIDTALEYRLAIANAESAKSTLARRQETYKRSIRGLQLLLGRYPDADVKLADALPEVTESIPSDIPSSVLERRPDVLAAERRLASAAYSVNAAVRGKLPSIMITSATGLQTDDFHKLLDGNYDFWRAELTLSQPIYAGGRIDAAAKQAQAAYDQYKALYEQVALQAFFEVEQALDADQYFADLERSSRAASEQSVEAEKLAWDQYTAGLIDIVTVLESQRYAMTAKQSAIEARNARIQNRIQLYLALGGDV